MEASHTKSSTGAFGSGELKRGITLSKKNWRITYPTGMGSPFDKEQLLLSFK